ncbi:MAG: endoribonuclease MazF [Cytophagales bacterium]|nr:endoribonuclease MazF [Cytophagales bacterium]
MPSKYTPDKGDVVWLSFDPQTGHEQSGRRPALVISPKKYNSKVRLALFCPVTGKIKGYPYEVAIPPKLKIKGTVLADQVKSLDWKVRKAEYICKIPDDILIEVLEKVNTLLQY